MVQSEITQCMTQYNASGDRKVKLNTTQKKKINIFSHVKLNVHFL